MADPNQSEIGGLAIGAAFVDESLSSGCAFTSFSVTMQPADPTWATMRRHRKQIFDAYYAKAPLSSHEVTAQ